MQLGLTLQEAETYFVGYKAGYSETGSNKLYMANDQNKSIIYGDLSTGQILLGNANPTGYVFKGTRTLNVIGGIIADSVRVALSNTWADYVFDKNYKLSKLNDLEYYIETNKHLPNIPSAEEVKDNGISVSEMTSKLLEKVEELSLYLIQQQKQIKLQQRQIQELQKKINRKN